MLSRLIKALRYIFTGSLEKQAIIDITPVSVTPAPSSLIMKDSFTKADGKTTIEVRSDGIHVQSPHAENTLIPLDATAIQLQDVDEDIRIQITRKISLLVPDLASGHKQELLDHVFNILSLMANDQLPRVRQMIAEELSEIYNAPLELVKRLAWDDHLQVCAPILEFSPLLTDQELMDIIAESKIPGVMDAISRRKTVSENVSEAIVLNVTQEDEISDEKLHIIETLLNNKGAKLNQKTLDIIIEEAEDQQSWHQSLIDRPELTVHTINKIARFVSNSMISEMTDRGMISNELATNLTQAVADRLQNPQRDREKEADRQALEMLTNGTLDNEYLLTALEAGEREFIFASLTLLSQMQKSTVRSIFEADDAKAVTALAWRAGLPMRTAIQLQLKQAKIHYTKILYAKNGKDFPMTDAIMNEMLESWSKKVAA